MKTHIRILAVAGSLRKESLNKKLLAVGVEALRQAGAEVDVLHLDDVPMPLYSQDIEDTEGLPPGALEFKRRIDQADGLLFVSPEYNYSIPGVFKNALDWASRGVDDVFRGKVGAIMAASPGGAGGMRMIPHLRQVMRALGVLVIHEQVTLSKAREAFKEDGSLASPHVAHQVQTLAEALLTEVRLRKYGLDCLRVMMLPERQAADAEKPR